MAVGGTRVDRVHSGSKKIQGQLQKLGETSWQFVEDEIVPRTLELM